MLFVIRVSVSASASVCGTLTMMVTMMMMVMRSAAGRERVSSSLMCSGGGGAGSGGMRGLVESTRLGSVMCAYLSSAPSAAGSSVGDVSDGTRWRYRSSKDITRECDTVARLVGSMCRSFSATAKKQSKTRSAKLKQEPSGTHAARGMNVVVFGGSGYVGRRVCRELIAMNNNASVTALVSDKSGSAKTDSKAGDSTVFEDGSALKIDVTSISRGGCFTTSLPSPTDEDKWIQQVKWLKADATDLLDSNTMFEEDEANQLISTLREADAVISCIGAFGSNEFMVVLLENCDVAHTKQQYVKLLY